MSLEQKRAAIIKATQVRKARADLKDQVRRGNISLSQAMAEPWTQTMELRKLLLCLPGIGKAKTDRILKRLMIGQLTKVKDLSEVRRRQLEELVG